MTLQELITRLQNNPDTWDWGNLPADVKYNIVDYYNKQRRNNLYKVVWMHCTNAQVNNINNLLPPKHRVRPVPLVIGGQGLSIDLLSDCRRGFPYFPARSILRNLKFVYSQAVVQE